MPYHVHSDPNADDGYWRDHERECARGEHCADPRLETVDGKTLRFGAWTPRAFCDACRDQVEHALRGLPALHDRVRDEIGETGKAAGPKVAISKSAPVPINLAVDELLRDMAVVVVSWHERVAAVARLDDPDGDVARACTVLAAHVDVLLALPAEPMMRAMTLRDAAGLPPGTAGLVHVSAGYVDAIPLLGGANAGLEVLALHRRARRLLGETRIPARHLHGVLCRCGHKQLYETLDGHGQWDGAHCRHCRTDWTLDEYRDLVGEAAGRLRRAGVRRRRLVSALMDDLEARRA